MFYGTYDDYLYTGYSLKLLDYSLGLLFGIWYLSPSLQQNVTCPEDIGNNTKHHQRIDFIYSCLEIAVIVLSMLLNRAVGTLISQGIFDIKYLTSGIFWIPLILLTLWLISKEKGIISRRLCCNTIIWGANISFEFYIVHYTVIIYSYEWFNIDTANENAYVLSIFFISLFFSWILYCINKKIGLFFVK